VFYIQTEQVLRVCYSSTRLETPHPFCTPYNANPYVFQAAPHDKLRSRNNDNLKQFSLPITRILCEIPSWGSPKRLHYITTLIDERLLANNTYVFLIIIMPTRCTNFSNLFLEWNSTCFGQFLCPSSGVFHCTRINGICHTGLLTVWEQDQDGTTVPSWSCSQAVSIPAWHIPLLCVQWKTPDDGQRNCPKHVDFHSKNKFEKLLHLVGIIIRNLRNYCI
jgi:hypothetical protein